MSHVPNPFLGVLNSANVPATDPREPALVVLREFCEAIEHDKPEVLCKLIPSYNTNMGREFRVVLTSKKSGYEHTLLRAYIPITPRGMKLDLYDFSIVDCPDVAALQGALKLFLQRPETVEAIRTYASQ